MVCHTLIMTPEVPGSPRGFMSYPNDVWLDENFDNPMPDVSLRLSLSPSPELPTLCLGIWALLLLDLLIFPVLIPKRMRSLVPGARSYGRSVIFWFV